MKTVIATSKAPAAIGPYSQAIQHNQTLYISGQLPIDAGTGEVCRESVAEQTRLAMQNLKNVIEAAGSNLDKVLKTTCLLTDLAAFNEFNEAYAEFFVDQPPARACFQVSALPKGVDVEIEAICAV